MCFIHKQKQKKMVASCRHKNNLAIRDAMKKKKYNVGLMYGIWISVVSLRIVTRHTIWFGF